MGLIPLSVGGFGIRDYFIMLHLNSLNIDFNLFLILILFNLRYFIPAITSVLVSFFKFKI